MRTITTLLALALAGSPSAIAAEQGGTQSGSDPAMAKAMEKMQPGPEHQQLAKRWVGSWDVAMKMWMDPSQPPTESKGTSTCTSVFDGRFIRGDFQGEFMGKPFQGLGFDGYDRNLGQYTMYWCDSMGTAPMFMTGKASADGKTITYTGTMSDCMKGGAIPARAVTTHVDDRTIRFEMFSTRDGKEQKGMELTYTKQ